MEKTFMKVLAINGSARKDGNTAILINTVFEELNKEGIETEMVQLTGRCRGMFSQTAKDWRQ
jgi:multimeric flavodoxin WrbA